MLLTDRQTDGQTNPSKKHNPALALVIMSTTTIAAFSSVSVCKKRRQIEMREENLKGADHIHFDYVIILVRNMLNQASL